MVASKCLCDDKTIIHNTSTLSHKLTIVWGNCMEYSIAVSSYFNQLSLCNHSYHCCI